MGLLNAGFEGSGGWSMAESIQEERPARKWARRNVLEWDYGEAASKGCGVEYGSRGR